MDKLSAARIDSGMTDIGRRIVFKENQIALLQISCRGDFRPLADGRESRRAVTARAYAAGSQAKVDESRTVEPF